MSLRAKLAFCVRCNKEQPIAKRLRGSWCLVCGDRVLVASKYGNKPTRSKHTGRIFQSKREANREPVLLALLNSGQITDLRYQTAFRLELYGTQAVDSLLSYLEEQTGVGDTVTKILVQDIRRSRQCVAVYKADFTYRTKDGTLVVEDPKGFVKPEYRMKKRLMLLAHGVEIQEPKEGGVQQRARGCGISGRGTGARLAGGR